MIEAIHTSGVSTLFVRLFTGGQWANLDAGVLEAWNGANVADYALALAEAGDSGLYVAAIPAWLPVGTYTVTLYDSDLGSNPIGSGTLYWDGAKELTPLVLQAHGDAAWANISTAITVYTQLGTGEVLWNEIKVRQFESIGPWDFAIYDAEKPPQPYSVEGHEFTFVCLAQDGTHLWQIENCPVFGDFQNRVLVESGPLAIEPGNYRYNLWDVTDNKVRAHGRLIVEVAAAPVDDD